MLETHGSLLAPTSGEPLRPLDAAIFARTRAALPLDASFEVALAVLGAVVRETIPNGRLFYLGEGPRGPVVGSLVSGVGLTPSGRGVLLVRLHPFRVLARLQP